MLRAGTTSRQIERRLSELHTALPFIGVYAADQLPHNPVRPFSLIVNYDKAGLPGSHWVAMAFPAIGNAEYFDSYGLEPDQADGIIHTSTQFARYLRAHSATGTFTFNRFDYQCLGTGTCGEYCTYFIQHGSADTPGGIKPWLRIREHPDCYKRDLTVRQLTKVLN